MKPKAPALLTLTLIAVLLSGAICKAHAWFDEDSNPQFQVVPNALIGYMLPTQNYGGKIYMHSSSWTEGDGTTKHSVSSTIDGFLQSTKMEGLWFEADLAVRTNSPVSFTTSFGYLFPANYLVQESYKGPGGQVASRDWKTQTTLWNLRFSVDLAVTESLQGKIGFLYDSLMISYSNPENILPGVNNQYLNIAQTGRVGVNVGIPFIGVQYEQPLRSRLDLKAYAIGFPGLLGATSYQESVAYSITDVRKTSQSANTVQFDGGQQISLGYFYEGLAQLSTPVWRGIGAGAFVKYSEYSGKLDHLDVTTGVSDPILKELKADVAFSRKPLVIGATITALF